MTVKPNSAFILVVEDDSFQQRVIQTLLQGLGHRVEVASNGLEALEKINRPYDIILMDVGLPNDPDGVEVSRQARTEGIKTPIIAITAHIAEHSKQRCLSAGMNEFIEKPLTREKLAAIIEKFYSL